MRLVRQIQSHLNRPRNFRCAVTLNAHFVFDARPTQSSNCHCVLTVYAMEPLSFVVPLCFFSLSSHRTPHHSNATPFGYFKLNAHTKSRALNCISKCYFVSMANVVSLFSQFLIKIVCIPHYW